MKQLTIIQPYVPEYRVPCVEGLTEVLATDGIACTLNTMIENFAGGVRRLLDLR